MAGPSSVSPHGGKRNSEGEKSPADASFYRWKEREGGGQPWSRTSVSDDRRLAGPVGMQRSDGSPALGQTCVPARLVRSRPRPLFLWAGPNSLTHYFSYFSN
jgi:hypothetical protein